jgi:hypothetical protein
METKMRKVSGKFMLARLALVTPLGNLAQAEQQEGAPE